MLTDKNLSNIVQPEEMHDARLWQAEMLAALTATSPRSIFKPEITLIHQDWGPLRTGISVSSGPLCLAGTKYATGLGTHATSAIRVRLPSAGRRLTGLCGVDDNPDTRQHTQSLVFSIELAGGEVWRSGVLDVTSAPAKFALALGGQREFILKVDGPIQFAHATWANLKVTLANGQTAVIGDPEMRSCGFDFRYAGEPVSKFLAQWKMTQRRYPAKDGIVLHRITRTDPETGLAVICDIKEYTRFPVVEWGLRLKNTSKRKTPLIENVRSLDIRPHLGPFPYLNYWMGDYCVQDGYEPFRVPLAHQEEYHFAPLGGRPTNRAWPYYNLECPTTARGLIVVVGWSGQWAASFRGLEGSAVHVTAGQELTHFKLLPGEEVRTPLSVLMFYRGDRVRSQNLWRRWMMAHNVPRPGGRLPVPMLPAYTGRWFAEMAQATEETQIAFLDRYLEEGIKLDYWWMDAGWYPCAGEWPRTGTWEVDRQRFPRGLRAVSDHAHRRGVKTVVWFEPERVNRGTWLWTEHPEWLLKGPDENEGDPIHSGAENRLLDLGNPKAQRWLVERVTKLIREEGIDLYRQDFNFEPLPYWRANDAPDRQGITEIRHVEGYLAFWQELRRRFPGMLIDTCASGGRRNDLETLRLSVPLHKTDYNYDDLPTKHAFHHSLSSWVPYYGAYVLPVDTVDVYAFRSSLAPMTMLTYDLRRRDADWGLLKRLTDEWRTLGPLWFGDYYPLTAYNRDDTQWIAWQFHRADQDRGLVQVFARARSAERSASYHLQGLDPKQKYRITDADAPDRTIVLSGADLMQKGLMVKVTAVPQAKVICYEKA